MAFVVKFQTLSKICIANFCCLNDKESRKCEAQINREKIEAYREFLRITAHGILDTID